MAYDLDWTTSETPDELPGKTHISLLPLTVDDRNLTSLVLFGKGAPNYGEGQQENFLRILENFASPTPPVNPTIGQLWYNSDEALLNILNVDNQWVPITGVIVSETAPATPYVGLLWFQDSTNNLYIYGGANVWVPLNDNPTIRVGYNWEYNQLVDKYNAIVASNNVGTNCSDSYGWNQPGAALTKLYIPANPVTNVEWMFLINKWKEIAPIVGVDPNRFANRGFIIEDQYHIDETLGPTGEGKGIATVLSDYERTVEAAAAVYTNRFNFAPATLEMQSYPAVNRTSYWIDETYLDVEFEWADADAMHNFFISGGYVRINPTFNQQAINSTSEMWRMFIENLNGGIIIRACGTLDQSGNLDFTAAKSVFELPDSNVLWPVTTPENTIGMVIYKANETVSASLGIGSDGGYGGYGGGGSGITFDGAQLNGDGSTGNDTDLGWADITVEARRKLSAGRLHVRIAFDNETATQVTGLLGCNITAFKASSNWGTFVPSNVPTFPTIATAAFV